VNSAPYDNWLFKIKPAADASQDRLMSATVYGESVGE